jgi:hypothetical protein
VKNLLFLTIASVLVVACASSGRESSSPAEAVADAYGIKRFQEVSAVKYTFNAQVGDKRLARSWVWHPPEDRVDAVDGDGRVFSSYTRSAVMSGGTKDQKDLDAKYINDRYWLFFPFHLVWDGQAKIVDAGQQAGPIGKKQLRRLVVSYPSTGGYTPGDVYEVFLDDRYRLVEWIYRKGGAAAPTRTATWEDHRQVGPLVFSLTHRGPTEDFRIWFTDVAVRLKGDDRWLTPEG